MSFFILIFGSSEDSFVSSENEACLKQKWALLCLALGKEMQTNGELSSHHSEDTITRDNTCFHKTVSDTILMPQITVNRSGKELFLNCIYLAGHRVGFQSADHNGPRTLQGNIWHSVCSLSRRRWEGPCLEQGREL